MESRVKEINHGTGECTMKTVWIDADALPRAIRDVLVRASQRRKVPLSLVANRVQVTPKGARVQTIVVPKTPDAADDYIAQSVQTGDLVVTADVPLAARVVQMGGTVIQPRGVLLDKDNVEEHLSMRDFHEGLRSSGVEGGGPPPLSPKHIQQFSNALDRWLTRSGF